MSFATFVKDMFKGVTAPIDILQDWAEEPLKRWENNRTQANLDRDVEREIKKQTGVEEVKSRLKREEAEHESNLHIRMQTEIERLNAQTRQWEADQDAARRIKLLDAFKKYQAELVELNNSSIRAISSMGIEFEAKARNLVAEKTKQFEEMDKEYRNEIYGEIELVEEKFSNNPRVKEMIENTLGERLALAVEYRTKVLNELNEGLIMLSSNINSLTHSGQEYIQQVLANTLQVKSSALNLGGNIEDAKVIE